MNRVAAELHQIAEICAHESGDTAIVVRDAPERFDVIPVCLLGRLLKPFSDQTAGTIAYFKRVFGAKRIERLQALEEIYTVSGIKRAFVSIGEVTLRDLDELLLEIQGTAPCVRFLSEAETGALRKEFQISAGLAIYTTALLQKLYDIVAPFGTTEDLFCGTLPKLTLPIYQVSQKIRVLMYERMRRTSTSEAMWVMNMAKVLADLEMVPGTILKTPKGNFCVIDRIIRGGGAYKYALRALGSAADEEGHFLLYRGTRPLPVSSDWWQTLVDDFRMKCGENGFKTTFLETHWLLQNTPFRGKKITVIGNSLGGVHAQYDALFHPIQRVITVASPGITKRDAALISQSRLQSVQHYIEAEDIADQLGECHLGVGADPQKVAVSLHILQPGAKAATLDEISALRKQVAKPISDLMATKLMALPKAVANIANVIFKVHTRHTLLGACSETILTNQKNEKPLHEILRHAPLLANPQWECVRTAVPRLLSRL